MTRITNLIGGIFLLLITSTITNAQAPQSVAVSHLESILKQKDDNVILLDVRTEQEYGQSFINGAKNFNYLSDDFKEKIKGLDKTKIYYVYCFSGGRSSQAVNDMQAAGFLKAINVTGGIRAWTQAGYDIKDD